LFYSDKNCRVSAAPATRYFVRIADAISRYTLLYRGCRRGGAMVERSSLLPRHLSCPVQMAEVCACCLIHILGISMSACWLYSPPKINCPPTTTRGGRETERSRRLPSPRRRLPSAAIPPRAHAWSPRLHSRSARATVISRLPTLTPAAAFMRHASRYGGGASRRKITRLRLRNSARRTRRLLSLSLFR